MKSLWNQQIVLTGALVVLGASLSACGNVAYRQVATSSQAATATTTPDPSGTGTTITVDPSTLLPPRKFTAKIKGQESWTSAALDTDNLLKVRIKAGVSGGYDTGTGSTSAMPYDCIQYTVSAGVQSVQTRILSPTGGGAGSNCPGAPASEEFDFSSVLGPGHNSVEITVSDIMTDARLILCRKNVGGAWWTFYAADPCAQFSPVGVQYTTHIASFNMDVQLNGTSF